LQAGTASLASDYFVGGYNAGLAIRIPVLDIKEVGTGGGSIARVDDGGALHVGPESAGASPGPACYGRGGAQPTVTDAHVVLGHLDPDRFLAGRMRLDTGAAERALAERVAAPLDLDLPVAAAGIVAIATAAMANAVRAVTTERGLDPRDFALVAYGGAGPLHAVDVARELAVGTVVIPFAPGTFSAFGMLTADLRREYARTFRTSLSASGLRVLDEPYAELASEARTWLGGAGIPSDETTLERAIDVRYVGQNYSVTVPLPVSGDATDVKSAFDAVHLQRYGHHAPDEAAEIIGVRVSIVGRLRKPAVRALATGSRRPPAEAELGTRQVRFYGGEATQTRIVDRHALLAGNRIEGPAIVQEDGSATVLPAGSAATVDPSGHLIVEVGG
jgi:N-methylhydantoinase A